MNFQQLCEEHRPWSVRNFGTQTDGNAFPSFAGISEELGEYAAGYQRGDRGECLDALADVVIFLADFVARACVPGVDASLMVMIDEGVGVPRVAGSPLEALAIAVGNLGHAYLKHSQGIRGSEEERVEKLRGAVTTLYGTVFWVCAQVHGVDLSDVVAEAWGVVSARDWKAAPLSGVSE